MGDFGQYVVQVGRPYMWAQWLGGLQFLDHCEAEPTSSISVIRPKTSISATYMQQTIKRLRQRLKARLGLLKQLASLGTAFSQYRIYAITLCRPIDCYLPFPSYSKTCPERPLTLSATSKC